MSLAPVSRWVLIAASISGASAVVIGAFGAHGLEAYLASKSVASATLDPDLIAKRLDQFDTGAKYHLFHALALLGVSCLRSSRLTQATAVLFVLGIFLFSGSLYAIVLTNQTWFGAIAPLGGSAWIVGWALLAFVSSGRADEHTERET